MDTRRSRFDLARFHRAQDSAEDGYVDALGELRAGRKTQGSPARLVVVMGSHVDTQKLVSSMTLFAHLARRRHAAERPELGVLAEHAEAILAAAAAQGYPRCAFTEKALGAT